jgi:ribosomal protein S18 acetylase RimI-like enzyme
MLMNSFKQNTANHEEIKAHLLSCDFIPAIATYVKDVDAYADKIREYAERIEKWENGKLAGLIAFYANDPSREEAFITSLSVSPSFTGRGIASELLERCHDFCQGKGFARLSLEVSPLNVAAMKLYEKHKFVPREILGKKIRMTVLLKERP